MNKSMFIGLSIVLAVASIVASAIAQKQTGSQTLSINAQPSKMVAIAASDTSSDRLAHPPMRQTFTADPYQLAIFSEDNWQTPLTQAQFLKANTVLWEKALPHQYGPKFVLVSTQGNVLLLDEFINVASPHAVTLIGTSGEVIAQHSFQDVSQALNVSAADLTRQATSGWWISTPPLLADLGNYAVVKAGGTALEINLTTGSIGQIGKTGQSARSLEPAIEPADIATAKPATQSTVQSADPTAYSQKNPRRS